MRAHTRGTALAAKLWGTVVSRRGAAMRVLLPALLAWGCTERGLNAPPESPKAGSLNTMVVGEAAARVDAAGLFVMSAKAVDAKRPSLTEANARRLAAIYARDYGPIMRATLEGHRRAAIDFSKLSACGRTFYAESSLPDLPDAVPAGLRRANGPYWLVTLCEIGVPAVSVSVSAFATDIHVVNDKLVYPLDSGSEFWIIGIPPALQALPLPPEEAVRAAVAATGTPVNQVPVLVAPVLGDGVPQMARWRVSFERPVKARGVKSGREQTVSVAFIRRRGFREQVNAEVPVAESQETTLRWKKDQARTTNSKQSARDSLTVAAKQGNAVKFERVVLTGGSNQ